MSMRVTPQVVISSSIAHAQQEYDALANLQAQASTGNRIQKISDDPLAALQVLADQAVSDRLDSYTQNIGNVQTKLNTSVSTLTEVSQVLTQAKNLALQGANTSNDAATNGALADQVDSLVSRILDLANARSGDQYLYGGTASNTAPFVVSANNAQGQPDQVVYQGAQQRASAPVGVTQNVSTFYVGSEVFESQQRQATVFSGSTGAAAGSGTDSATGEGTLTVAHTSTTYAAGSGVQAGTSSAAGDTVLGPAGANTLTVVDTSGTGAAGTVSLNGGPAVAFTNGDTDLRVTDSSGGVVYVNTTAITAGFNGSVAITSNGTLSVDGGASTVPITFSGNQVVTDSQTGAVTNVNSSAIRQTGTDRLSYSGTYDAFQALTTLRDDLRNVNNLSQADQVAGIQQIIGELGRIQTNVLGVVGEQSADLQNLDALKQHASDVQLQTKTLISNLQSADITSVVVNLQAQQNLLALTLDSTSRVIGLSLLDFLH